MVICEYLEESLGGAGLYPVDALSRARQRGWIEFGTATLADAWQFLNAKDHRTADAKQVAFRDRLQRLEAVLAEGPYFGGAAFGMVDAVFAPLFRYFDILNPTVSQPILENLPRVSAWRAALAARESVIAAAAGDYAERFRQHLRQHQALLAD
jgi:glutathione S-transferase